MKISVVYLVAGLSSRFNGKIKQFAKIGPNSETLIEFSMTQAVNAGISEIVFIVGEKTENPFKKMFGDSFKGIPIKYTKQTFDPSQRDKPWGTADALCQALSVLENSFIACNGDDIYGESSFKTLIKSPEENSTLAYKLIENLPNQGSTNRGIIQKNLEGDVKEIKEFFNIEKNNLKEKNLSSEDLCSMNFFKLNLLTLKLLNEKLEKFKEEHQGDRKSECLLPKELSDLIKEGKIKMKVYPNQEKWLGITNPEDEEKIRKELSKPIL